MTTPKLSQSDRRYNLILFTGLIFLMSIAMIGIDEGLIALNVDRSLASKISFFVVLVVFFPIDRFRKRPEPMAFAMSCSRQSLASLTQERLAKAGLHAVQISFLDEDQMLINDAFPANVPACVVSTSLSSSPTMIYWGTDPVLSESAISWHISTLVYRSYLEKNTKLSKLEFIFPSLRVALLLSFLLFYFNGDPKAIIPLSVASIIPVIGWSTFSNRHYQIPADRALTVSESDFEDAKAVLTNLYQRSHEARFLKRLIVATSFAPRRAKALGIDISKT